MTILDVLKSDARLTFIASIGTDRHLFQAEVAAIEERDDFQRLRGKPIEKLDVLQSSLKRTNGSLYPIVVFAELDAVGAAHLIVVDGHQRLRAEIQNGATTVAIQYVSRWTTIAEAFAEAVDLNFARYAVGEDDLISILQTGKMTVAEVAAHTGYSETKVRDFAKIATIEWACDLLASKAVGRTTIAKLIDACDSNGNKLAALGNTLTTKLNAAKVEAEKIANQIKADKKRDFGAKFRERGKVAFYFKDENWAGWIQAIEDHDGQRQLVIEGGAGKSAAPFVGTAKDWEQDVAVYDFFGEKIDNILTEDFERMRAAMPQIATNLDTIIAQRRAVEARAAHPTPVANPVVEIAMSSPPVEQNPVAKVGRRTRKG